jgi:group I intron endonuclease
MYIYTITNLLNGKVYVGQTVQENPKMRWYAHLADTKRGKKSYLYDSMRKYGIDNFQWEIVQQASNIDELNILETSWEQKFKLEGKILYNNRGTGNNKLHSEQSILKMKESQKAAHARRRLNNGGAEKHKEPIHKGKKNQWVLTEEQKQKKKDIMKEVNKRSFGGKTWKVIEGKRVWLDKGAAV